MNIFYVIFVKILILMTTRVIFSGLLLFFLAACMRPSQPAPDLPAYEDFGINANILKELSTGGTSAKTAYNITNEWVSLLSDSIFLCFNAFAEYDSVQPVSQENDFWLWTEDFAYADKIYSSSLLGRSRTDTVFWFQYITDDTLYVDYKWMTGKYFMFNDSASWQLTNHPLNPTNMAYVYSSQNTSTGNIRQIGYSTIHFRLTTDSSVPEYHQFWELLTGSGEYIYIQTDSLTRAGRIRYDSSFGDTLWHCWDSNLTDIPCP